MGVQICQEPLLEIEMRSEAYINFMTQYKKDHEVCPKCGSTGGCTTLMGYPFYSDNPSAYKDLNSYTCSKCNDIHKVHDRISKEEFENKKQ